MDDPSRRNDEIADASTTGGLPVAPSLGPSLAVEHLADEVLVRDGHQGRVAERDDLLQPTGEFERVQCVLVEVVSGIDDDPLGRHPRPQRAIDPPA